MRTSREVTFCPAAPGTGRIYELYTIDGQLHRVASLHNNGGCKIRKLINWLWNSKLFILAAKASIDITKCAKDKIMKARERWEMNESFWIRHNIANFAFASVVTPSGPMGSPLRRCRSNSCRYWKRICRSWPALRTEEQYPLPEREVTELTEFILINNLDFIIYLFKLI